MADLSMPTICGFRSVTFKLVHAVAQRKTRGAVQEAVELGYPVWVAEYETTTIPISQVGAWEAFFAQLRGGLVTMKMTDPLYKYPQSRFVQGWAGLTVGGNPYTGGGSVLSNTATSLTLQQLPQGLELRPGDMVSYEVTNGPRYLHRITNTATVSPAGEVVVDVFPHVKGDVSGSAIELEAPWCRARVDDATVEIARAGVSATVRFTAGQTL